MGELGGPEPAREQNKKNISPSMNNKPPWHPEGSRGRDYWKHLRSPTALCWAKRVSKVLKKSYARHSMAIPAHPWIAMNNHGYHWYSWIWNLWISMDNHGYTPSNELSVCMHYEYPENWDLWVLSPPGIMWAQSGIIKGRFGGNHAIMVCGGFNALLFDLTKKIIISNSVLPCTYMLN